MKKTLLIMTCLSLSSWASTAATAEEEPRFSNADNAFSAWFAPGSGYDPQNPSMPMCIDTTAVAKDEHGSASASVKALMPYEYGFDYDVEAQAGQGYSFSRATTTIRSR